MNQARRMRGFGLASFLFVLWGSAYAKPVFATEIVTVTGGPPKPPVVGKKPGPPKTAEEIALWLQREMRYAGPDPESLAEEATNGAKPETIEKVAELLAAVASDKKVSPVQRYAALHGAWYLAPGKAVAAAQTLLRGPDREFPLDWKRDFVSRVFDATGTGARKGGGPVAIKPIDVEVPAKPAKVKATSAQALPLLAIAMQHPDDFLASYAIDSISQIIEKTPAAEKDLGFPFPDALEKAAREARKDEKTLAQYSGKAASALRALQLLPERKGVPAIRRLFDEAVKRNDAAIAHTAASHLVSPLKGDVKKLTAMAKNKDEALPLRESALSWLFNGNPDEAKKVAAELLVADPPVPDALAVGAVETMTVEAKAKPSEEEVQAIVRLLGKKLPPRAIPFPCTLASWWEAKDRAPALDTVEPLVKALSESKEEKDGDRGCVLAALALLPGDDAAKAAKAYLKKTAGSPDVLAGALQFLKKEHGKLLATWFADKTLPPDIRGILAADMTKEQLKAAMPEVFTVLRDLKLPGVGDQLARQLVSMLAAAPEAEALKILEDLKKQPHIPFLDEALLSWRDKAGPDRSRPGVGDREPRLIASIDALRKKPLEDLAKENEKKDVDACSAVCAVVDQHAKWTAAEFEKTAEFRGDKELWGYAKRALAATFLRKALPFCPKAKAPLETIERWLATRGAPPKPGSGEKKTKESGGSSLLHGVIEAGIRTTEPGIRAAIESSERSTTPLIPDSGEIYSKQFLLTVLREKMESLPAGKEKDELAVRVTAAEKSLNSDLAQHRQLQSSVQGSHFNSYAVVSAAILSPEPPYTALASLGQLEAATKLNPATTPYGPVGYSPDTSLGGLARSITLNVGLALHTAPGAGADTIRDRYLGLMESLFESEKKDDPTRFEMLAAELFREGTHGGKNNIAAYYLYGNALYWAAGLSYFLRSDLPPEVAKRMQALRPKLAAAILKLRRTDGMFPTGGPITYFNGPSYVNPLLAMALIPLIDDCDDGKGGRRKFAKPALGILDEPLLARKKKRMTDGGLSPQEAHQAESIREATGRAISDLWNRFRPRPTRDRPSSPAGYGGAT